MAKTYTCAGQTMTAAQWAKELGISRDAFYQRLTDFEDPSQVFVVGHLRKPRRKNQFHGHSNTPTYNTWTGMIRRCTVPESKKWHMYGARGIKVCERWLNFNNFLEDMGERPKGTTLDRYPNKDGNYEKSNCRWATPKEQGRNTRSCLEVIFEGVKMSPAEAAEKLGIAGGTLRRRLKYQRRTIITWDDAYVRKPKHGLAKVSGRK